MSCSYFTKELYWVENPGRGLGVWKKHAIDNGWSVEFVFLVDIDNDGKKQELLPQFGQTEAPLAWYELKNGAFVRHVVSPHSYGHGIGAGDVNGDGRTDILTPKGWFEAPPDPRSSNWKFHPDWDLEATGFLYVVDVNGDGRNDVVTSSAHGYGLFWLEHGDANHWTRHMIDESWSQAHAMTMVDLNGDGRMDFITGKRYMAHNGHDPGEREPLGIYWYEHLKSDNGKIEWVKHVIDYGSRTGGGMQIPVADLDGDGDLDFVVAGEKRPVPVRKSHPAQMTFLDRIHSTLNAAGLQEVLRLTMEHFHADTGTIHLLESDGVLHLKAASAGIPGPVLKAVELVPIGKGMAGLAVQRKEPVSVCNLQTDASGNARPGAKATGMEGALVVPILQGGDAVGALGIANRAPRTFSPEEIALLMDIGRAIASQRKPI